MATVTLGELPLARIGLGTNRLTNTPENVAFVREAVAAGIGLIDTAHSYTGGRSEQTIGAAVSSPDACVVATKGGYGSGRPEVLSAEIKESLRRLRTDNIGLYYLHRPVRASDDVVDYCAGNGIVFVPYFPLRADGGPAATEIAKRHGATPQQVALAWLLRRSPATLPIPGTLSLEHLRENLAAAEIELSDDEFEALR